MANVAKFKIDLAWKNFSVSLPLVGLWLSQNAGGLYCGTQAAAQLEVWFTDIPDQSIIDAVNSYWNALDEASSEAVNYVSQTAVNAAITSLKESLLSLSWDAMSMAQRKLMVGQTPSLYELGLSAVSGV